MPENLVKFNRARPRKSISSENNLSGMSQPNSKPAFLDQKVKEHIIIGQDPHDPISDSDLDQPKSTKVMEETTPVRNSRLVVEITSKSPIDTRVADDKIIPSNPSKTANNDRNFSASAVSSTDRGIKSHYFDQLHSPQSASNSSRPRLAPNPKAKIRRIEQAMAVSSRHRPSSKSSAEDEHSPDELAGLPPSSSDPRNKQEAQVLIDGLEKLKRSKSVSKSRHPHAISPSFDDDSEDEDTRRSKEIKRTNFRSAKISKDSASIEERYEIKEVFCPTHAWLLAGEDQKHGWSIVQDGKTGILKVLNGRGREVEDLVLKSMSINKILLSEDCSKMQLIKSTDETVKRAPHIFLELETPQKAARFANKIKDYSPTISIIWRSRFVPSKNQRARANFSRRDHLQKVFNNVLQKLNSSVRPQPPPADDVRFIEERREIKQSKQQTVIQQSEPSPSVRKLKDDMTTADSDLPDHKKDAKSVDIYTCDRHEDPSKQTRQLGQDPKDFYGKSNMSSSTALASHRTRSSSRINDQHQKPFQRIPKVPIFASKWTEDHPDWARTYKWKKSVIYPQEGKKKTTVDEQDIPRLDEDEFLNDNLIHFYFNILEQRLLAHKPETAKRILFMNSFFYLRLTSGVKGKSGINYEAVERWTAKFRVFEYDYIVIPVNESAHWYLAIICNTPKFIQPAIPEPPETQQEAEASSQQEENNSTFQQPEVSTKLNELSLKDGYSKTLVATDPKIDGQTLDLTIPPVNSPITSGDVIARDAKDSEIQRVDLTQPTKLSRAKKSKRKSMVFDISKPRIITLDSLDQTHSPTCTNLRKWLICEAKSKLDFEITELERSVGMTARNIPLQPNFADCGLYLLMYLEKFLEDPDAFAADIMADRFRDHPMELPTSSAKRMEIRWLLFCLQEDPSADVEKLKLISSRYNQSVTEKKNIQIIELESGAQEDSKSCRTSPQRPHPHPSGMNAVTDAEEKGQKHPNTSKPHEPTQASTHVLDGDGHETSSLSKSGSSVFDRLKSGISEIFRGHLENPSAKDERRAHELSKSKGSKEKDDPIQLPESSNEAELDARRRSNTPPLASNEVDLCSPSPDPVLKSTSHAEDKRVKVPLHEKFPEALDSSNSSNTHTFGDGDEADLSANKKSPKHHGMVIVDSQETEDEEMLLCQDVDPSLLTESDAGQAPTPSDIDSARKLKTTSPKLQQSQGHKPIASTPSRTRKRRLSDSQEGYNDSQYAETKRVALAADSSDLAIIGKYRQQINTSGTHRHFAN
jgi:sentrin-specific protease 7